MNPYSHKTVSWVWTEAKHNIRIRMKENEEKINN